MMKIEPVLREILLLNIVVIATGWTVYTAMNRFSEEWAPLSAVAAIFFVQGVMKFFIPRHSVLGRFSWLYYVVAASLFLAIVVILSGFTPLGFFPAGLAVIGLVFAIVIVHSTLGPRPDDDTTKTE